MISMEISIWADDQDGVANALTSLQEMMDSSVGDVVTHVVKGVYDCKLKVIPITRSEVYIHDPRTKVKSDSYKRNPCSKPGQGGRCPFYLGQGEEVTGGGNPETV